MSATSAARDHTAAHTSTGPRTPAGKAASSRNALSHGLLSDAPIATPYEQPQDWQDHRAAILQRLAPADHLETVLAENIALLLWRKARVGRAEAGLIAKDQLRLAADNDDRRFARPDGCPSTMADLAAEREARAETLRHLEGWPDLDPSDQLDARTACLLLTGFLNAFSPLESALPYLPDLQPDEDLAAYCNRRDLSSVERVVAALAPLCAASHESLEDLHAKALQHADWAFQRTQRARSDDEIAALNESLRLTAELRTLEKLQRYEAHLSRELARACHELERFQATRTAESNAENCQTDSCREYGAPSTPVQDLERVLAARREIAARENCETNSAPGGSPTTPVHDLDSLQALPRARGTDATCETMSRQEAPPPANTATGATGAVPSACIASLPSALHHSTTRAGGSRAHFSRRARRRIALQQTGAQARRHRNQ